MGCDIHGYVEIRDARPEILEKYLVDYAPRWIPIINVGTFLDRNYNLFGILAGVRWEMDKLGWEPIAPDRGIPDDANWRTKDALKYYDKETKNYIEDSDYHSKTYMSLSEIEAWDWKRKIREPVLDSDFNWTEKETTLEAYCDQFKTIRELMQTLVDKYGDKNVRLIIWFDN